MKKKDYELIAGVLKTYITTDWLHNKDTVAKMLADELSVANPKFDRNKFLIACGIELHDYYNGKERQSIIRD